MVQAEIPDIVGRLETLFGGAFGEASEMLRASTFSGAADAAGPAGLVAAARVRLRLGDLRRSAWWSLAQPLLAAAGWGGPWAACIDAVQESSAAILCGSAATRDATAPRRWWWIDPGAATPSCAGAPADGPSVPDGPAPLPAVVESCGHGCWTTRVAGQDPAPAPPWCRLDSGSDESGPILHLAVVPRRVAWETSLGGRDWEGAVGGCVVTHLAAAAELLLELGLPGTVAVWLGFGAGAAAGAGPAAAQRCIEATWRLARTALRGALSAEDADDGRAMLGVAPADLLDLVEVTAEAGRVGLRLELPDASADRLRAGLGGAAEQVGP